MFRRPRGNYRNIPPRKAGSSGPPPIVPIRFADLFPGAYQVVQTDLGLSYGAVMRADAGNTSSVAFALTGATPAVPVPIWIRITAPGVGNVYYDGLGVTPAMVGVTIVDSVNIVLTGAGAGMAITPGVGSQVVGNTWRATCSGLADQSGNGFNTIQLTPAQQPIVTVGLNGKPGLLFDGVDDVFVSNIATLAQPYQIVLVGRLLDPSIGNKALCGGGPGGFNSGLLYTNSGSLIFSYSGGFGPSLPFTSSANTRFACTYTGTTADTLLVGSASATGANGGATTGPNVALGANVPLSQYGNCEIFAAIYTPPVPSLAAFDTALNTPAGYGPGAIAI